MYHFILKIDVVSKITFKLLDLDNVTDKTDYSVYIDVDKEGIKREGGIFTHVLQINDWINRLMQVHDYSQVKRNR